MSGDDVRLKLGHKVDGRWQVTKKLGQGAFGAVYEAIDLQKKVVGPKALKLESIVARDQVLKIEVAVLRAVGSSNHVCQLYACGRNDRFNFMLMSLLGPSLANLRKRQPEQKFSMSTAVNVTLQALQSLNDLHNAGWLHRDVKPSNYAMGHTSDPETKRTVFILDFGLSRFFFTSKGQLRAPRELVGFRGTLRYCSLNGHKGKELGRHDDLISLLYMMHEMIRGSLPWKKLDTNHEVASSKEETIDDLYDDLPPKLLSLHEYLHTLRYEDKPRYNHFQDTLFELVKNPKGLKNAPMDWESSRQKVTDLDSKVDVASDVIQFQTGPRETNDNPGVADLPKSRYREIIKKKPEKEEEDDDDE